MRLPHHNAHPGARVTAHCFSKGRPRSRMNPADASRTALATSMMRSVHSRADPAPLLDDPWGERLVPESVQLAIRQRAVERMGLEPGAKTPTSPDAALVQYLRANPAYPGVIVRSRYTEDALQAAAAHGITQYVLIGAGFDSFACRRPAWADRLSICEVDHPATQSLKLRRLAECGVPSSDSVHYVAADLSQEGLEAALSRSPFQCNQPAFFSWLGVTVYLSRAANLTTLRAIGSCSAPGSELVFSYSDQAVFDPAFVGTESFRALWNRVSAIGEAFLSGFDPKTLGDELWGAGLELLEDLDGAQAIARYDRAGANHFRSAPHSHIAHARVTGARSLPAHSPR